MYRDYKYYNQVRSSVKFFLGGHAAYCIQFIPNCSTGTTRNDVTDIEYARFERPFMSSGTCGSTVWYTSSGGPPLRHPAGPTTPNPGDIYIHTDTSTNGLQIWVCPTYGTWKSISAEYDQSYLPDRVVRAARHPLFNDRVLKMRANGEPSWVTRQTCITLKSRKKGTYKR